MNIWIIYMDIWIYGPDMQTVLGYNLLKMWC